MMAFIDSILDRVTMYRLILYVLAGLAAISIIFGLFGLISYNPLYLLLSLVYILAVCWIVNTLLAKLLSIPANIESVYITAFILFLIVSPFYSGNYTFFVQAGLISAIAIASKFLLVWRRRHIFNPAGFGVVATAFILGSYVAWWTSTPWMIPFIFAGGFLVAKKAERLQIVFSFILISFGIVTLQSIFGVVSGGLLFLITDTILHSPLIFFSFIMLTEPFTSPTDKKFRFVYAGLVSFLSFSAFHVGSFYFSTELALLIGNIFAFVVNPKVRETFVLSEKNKLSHDVYEFVFNMTKNFPYKAGQYLEWTLGHDKSDTRGNRRYFTIASSPTENNLRIGIKFYPDGSTFKKRMVELKPGESIIGSRLAGEFVLPKDQKEKLVFLAGGIGVTPFRSMIKFLLDREEKRDISFFFANKTVDDIVYKDIFDAAEKNLGIKIIHAVEKLEKEGGNMKPGRLNKETIIKEVPDYKERTFYISGPPGMIFAFEDILRELGIPKTQIKTDFFPGYA